MANDPLSRSTLDLTAAVADGDPEAFAELYRRHFDALYREVRRLTGRGEDFCLDVVQDAMVRVIKSLGPIESEAALARWLAVTVRSVAIDHLRRDGRRARRERVAAERRAADRGDGSRRGADATEAELAERLAWVRGEMRQLDDGARALLVMRHGLGRTLGQIGAELGLGAGAVHGRLQRLVAGLGRRARKEFDDDRT